MYLYTIAEQLRMIHRYWTTTIVLLAAHNMTFLTRSALFSASRAILGYPYCGAALRVNQGHSSRLLHSAPVSGTAEKGGAFGCNNARRSTCRLENTLLQSTPCEANKPHLSIHRRTTTLKNSYSQLQSHRQMSTVYSSCYFDSAKFVIPHPSKKHKEGEDAAFCTAWHLGVADGVGGWTLSGVDAGLYSRELINRIEQILQKDEMPTEIPSPVEILGEAYRNTRAIGSSTCCLVFLDAAKMVIKSANLGDSGFIVYRPSEGKVVHQSEFQYHDFNFPLQLGTGSLDLPEHAQQGVFNVLAKDWVIIGTDGLWDNLYEDQIVKILTGASNPSVIARTLAKSAYRFSQDPHWKSPFIERDIRLGAHSNCSGGKPDDISVVAAQIRESVSPFGITDLPQKAVPHKK